jgi:hypothetical protein
MSCSIWPTKLTTQSAKFNLAGTDGLPRIVRGGCPPGSLLIDSQDENQFTIDDSLLTNHAGVYQVYHHH